ncbi:MAG TPA: dihydroorotase [Bacteroidetes bacterium]|nr:dihydroorotase [Bacteroidota bacterium]
MSVTIIRNAQVINEGTIKPVDILIRDERIEKIDSNISVKQLHREIDGESHYCFPGLIDDQVHFREPGMTHKANIYTEAKAAVAGGTTSFMEMPNTIPPATTHELLEQKYEIASRHSLANYSFFLGTSNSNIEEVKKTDPKKICGIKIFMGSSTGDLAVDNPESLENIFKFSPVLIATHCEVDQRIKENTIPLRMQYGDAIPMKFHPVIRDEKACYDSSKLAIELARKHNSRLHILHISTANEIALFSNDLPLAQKKITAEACVHHLWFDSRDYATLGSLIKCNPAIKGPEHKPKLMQALKEGFIDVIATDHAPHTLEEKMTRAADGNINYFKAPSGLPLVQHSLNMLLEFWQNRQLTLYDIAQKAAHNPAICFGLKDRGFIREGYYADLALVNPQEEWTVHPDNIYYKCGWSPLEGHRFRGRVTHTFVNGHIVYQNGLFNENFFGKRLEFHR